MVRRQRRNIQMPARYADTVMYALPVESIDELVPTTFRKAEQSSEADSWLVAKGYAQEKGIDYNEVFSPVVKHSSIRILLALVAQYGLELDQLDVNMTFLLGDLDEEIYMTQGKISWSAIDELKVQLSNEFEMKDLGEVKRSLGMEIGRDKRKGRICLTQVAYLKKVL
ncbi:uncharacterized protein A4U43_C05F8630 [Asparagus officinalis]|uniref:Reverse transcriptase Ty1/copia-type domain-containing protein n=1 Tax=Asparagus officinalis TaxID=4686 RepID=A0A5P1EQ99_ASPOF|nr:uncharacterized protein A4U43_C05F8630 [Asparagus officinalis]